MSDGTTLQHYRFLLDARSVLHSVPPELQAISDIQLDASRVQTVPYDVWFDSEGMLRQASLRISLADQVWAQSVTVRGSDQPVSVTVPAARITDEVAQLAFFQNVAMPAPPAR
jgi:hypothetical protein